MHMSSSEAIQFCENVGLPKSNECIVFKSTSIDFDVRKLVCKREDSFVLGDDTLLKGGRVDDDDIYIPRQDVLFCLIDNN